MTDEELKSLLQQWQAPRAPARLRSAVLGEERSRWWQRSIRVPLPTAACVLVLLLAGMWGWLQPRRAAAPPATNVVTFREFRPVTELKPRIIRRGDARN